MREDVLLLLVFFLGSLSGFLSGSLDFGAFTGLDGPFFDGQAGLGSAGLKGDFIILDGQDTAGEAADGNDRIAGLQAGAQLSVGFFLLLLGNLQCKCRHI